MVSGKTKKLFKNYISFLSTVIYVSHKWFQINVTVLFN